MYENFKYLDAVAQKEITNGVFSGSVLSVIHKGETVYLKSFGLADKEKNIPMKTDSIFRLFSMSKPVTAAAAMILIERGLLDTRHPLKWFIPEFSDPVVLDENGERPADRDITIGDLLTMTSGIPYPDGTPAGQKMGALWGEQSEKYLKGEKLLDTVSFAKEMGKRPLMFSPGEKWMYGASADIMGAVIEASISQRKSTADLPSVTNTKMAETSLSLTSTFALLITLYLLPLSRAEQVLFPL